VRIPESLKKLFEPALIQLLIEKGKIQKFREGETIIDPGQSIKVMPIVLEGSVKVSRLDEDGRELLLYYLEPRESCAMTFTCCMQHHTSEIKAVAEEDVEILAVPISVMDEWLAKFSTWKTFVMNTIHARFNELLRSIDQIAFQKLDERLITYLREKTKTSGSALINLSHQQIADELATSRVVISRLLKKLERDGQVLLFRNQVKLLGER